MKTTDAPNKGLEENKWQLAAEKAAYAARWAKTMTKVVIAQNNSHPPFWHVINFLGKGKCESAGVVDLLAIRKCHTRAEAPLKRGDLFDIVLIQVKGGGARDPSADDVLRLRAVSSAYNARDVVLSSWKKGGTPVFRRLLEDGWSDEVDPALIFGKGSGKNRAAQKAAQVTPIAVLPGAPRPVVSALDLPSLARSASAKKAWHTRRSMLARDDEK